MPNAPCNVTCRMLVYEFLFKGLPIKTIKLHKYCAWFHYVREMLLDLDIKSLFAAEYPNVLCLRYPIFQSILARQTIFHHNWEIWTRPIENRLKMNENIFILALAVRSNSHATTSIRKSNYVGIVKRKWFMGVLGSAVRGAPSPPLPGLGAAGAGAAR